MNMLTNQGLNANFIVMKYLITTDATADYPKCFEEKDFYIIQMSYFMDGVLYDGIETPFLSTVDFYNKLAAGSFSKTAMATHDQVYKFFDELLSQGKDIIHISFAEPLSGGYACYCNVAEELREKYPDRKINIVDSKSASIGEGLLVWYALRNRDKGASYEDEVIYITSMRDNMGHLFTIDDIMHLYRGGRLKKNAALIGKTIQIKPILSCDPDGNLITIGKAIGKRNAIKSVLSFFENMSEGLEQEIIFIQHADNLKDAELLKSKVLEICNISEDKIIIDELGPIIGSHLGKGALTLSFKCKDRKEKLKFEK